MPALGVCLLQPYSSAGRRFAASRSRLQNDESFRFHNKKIDEMRCKLDSTENLRLFEKYLTPPWSVMTISWRIVEGVRVIFWLLFTSYLTLKKGVFIWNLFDGGYTWGRGRGWVFEQMYTVLKIKLSNRVFNQEIIKKFAPNASWHCRHATIFHVIALQYFAFDLRAMVPFNPHDAFPISTSLGLSSVTSTSWILSFFFCCYLATTASWSSLSSSTHTPAASSRSPQH